MPPKKTGLLRSAGLSCANARLLSFSRFDTGRFHSFFALRRFILHSLTVFQRPKALGSDIGVMHEQIVATVIGSNKPKTLLLVEPFYCTNTHVTLLGLKEARFAEIPSPSIQSPFRGMRTTF